MLVEVRAFCLAVGREWPLQRLGEQLCHLLAQPGRFDGAWLVFVDGETPQEPFVQAGFDGGFSSLVERLRGGELISCARRALASPDVQVVEDPSRCVDCPLAPQCGACLVTRLGARGQVVACLGVALPRSWAQDQTARRIFVDAADVIALLLREMVMHARHASLGERYINAMAASSDAVVATDLEDKILLFSPGAERLFGCSAREALGTSLSRFCPPEELQARNQVLARLLSGETPKTYEGERLTVDGHHVPVEITTSLYTDDEGLPVGISNVLRDITTRRRLEEQLRQVQRVEALGRLAGGVAHDFNNMLQVILSNVELALEAVVSRGSVYEALLEIQEAAQRSAELTQQLLAFARRQNRSPVVIDLNETVSKMLQVLARLLGEDIDLVWAPGDDLWAVRIDPVQVGEILTNLCINARDAIDEVDRPGVISIETDNVHVTESYAALHVGFVPGDYVRLTVSDNGCGMSESVRQHIFEPFFTTKPPGKGTGLGLPIVHGIVRQNGGFINVYSELGVGSAFKIYLPRWVGPNLDQGRGEAVTNRDLRGCETVLLVEDEPAIRRLGRILLEGLGYRVLDASSPLEALALAREQSEGIDLLITDVVMPEMSGKRLATRLQEIYPDLRCLFMSGYTENVIMHHGVLDKGVSFLPKPFTREQLARKVRQALDRG